MIYLLYILYAWLAGHTDAFVYGMKGAGSLPDNEHKWFVKQRILPFLFAMAGFGYGIAFGIYGAILLAVDGGASVLAYSFFHNGFYNLMRDRMHGWSRGWRYTSPSDTSEVNFDYSQRRGMLYASIAILIISYLLYFFVL